MDLAGICLFFFSKIILEDRIAQYFFEENPKLYENGRRDLLTMTVYPSWHCDSSTGRRLDPESRGQGCDNAVVNQFTKM